MTAGGSTFGRAGAAWTAWSRPRLAKLAAAARTVPFRAAVAAALLVVHLVLLVHSGAARFGVPFNVAPGNPPAFNDPARDGGAQRWHRLVVSRWDAGQYIGLGLRGYEHCAPRGAQVATFKTAACNLVFYPTFSLLGRALSRLASLPIDYALLALSLAASFLLLFLWTGETLVSRLGLAETYLSLLLLNVFTTGFTLATVQTEPLALLTTFGAFLALARRRFWLAALLAGAASGVRITGLATSAACGLALLVDAWQRRPDGARAWLSRAGALMACGWGQMVLMGYHAYRFGDPLAYLHAHAEDFHHKPSLLTLLQPEPIWLVRSMEHPLHEGVWLCAAMLWFLLGHRESLRRFSAPERVYWYVLFFATVGIAVVGQLPIALVGMNRYLLLALPLFFAMAATMRAKPLLLAFWLLISGWHYWNVDVCTYTGGPGRRTLEVCNTPHWVGRI